MAGDNVDLKDGSSVDKVSIKVPPFIPNDPELWFLLLENQFQASAITRDATKLTYALGALDAKYASEVRDVLLNKDKTYELLKSELIKRVGSSQEQNTRRLLENEPLGDRKPSQFLRHLRTLAGTGFPNELLQTLWLGRLPKHQQALLAAHKDLSLDKMAEIADSVADVYGPLCNINETTAPSAQNTALDKRLDVLEQTMSTIMQRLTSLEVNQSSDTSRSRSNFRNTNPRSFRPRSRSANKGGICYFHWRFGDQATKCEKPCKFNSEKVPENSDGSR